MNHFHIIVLPLILPISCVIIQTHLSFMETWKFFCLKGCELCPCSKVLCSNIPSKSPELWLEEERGMIPCLALYLPCYLLSEQVTKRQPSGSQTPLSKKAIIRFIRPTQRYCEAQIWKLRKVLSIFQKYGVIIKQSSLTRKEVFFSSKKLKSWVLLFLK